jgi:predicted dehydrogenase
MKLCILGTGGMAKHHAEHFARIDGVTIAACIDTNAERLAAFAKTFGIANTYSSVDAALAAGGFDAVTNVTPDAAHFATTMACVAAGKHVLCEKPLATNYADAKTMTEAAEKAGLVAMVNLTYRNVAALQEAHRIVASGEIGPVKHVEAAYRQSWLAQPAWGDWRTESQWLWRVSRKHGSLGVLGDVGIHIIDFATYATGLSVSDVFCRLHTFDKAPGGVIGDYVLDANDSFAMSVGFSNGAVGVIHASRFATGFLNELRLEIHGDKGAVQLTNNGDLGTLKICREANLQKPVWDDVPLKPVPTNYQRFVDAVRDGKTAEPSFAHAAAIQQVLDLGVVSDAERRAIAIPA